MRKPLFFRCTDAAYARLNLPDALRTFLADAEGAAAITLQQPPSPIGRCRKRQVDGALVERLNAIASRWPVSRDRLVREAIYRAIGQT